MPVAVDRRTQRRAVEVFASLLEDQDKLRREYRNRPRALLARYGYLFPGELGRLFDDAYHTKVTRIVGKSGRGGGKTKLAAGIAFAKFFFQDWNFLIVGGSKEQSLRGMEYVQDITGEPDLVDYIEDETRTLLRGERGNWGKAAPASTKAIRGLHAKGRPFLLVLDEEAEMDPEIVRAALMTGKDSHPFLVIRLSTNHMVTGTFAELVEDYKKLGYEKYEWDSFDVVERCQDNCADCMAEFNQLFPGDLEKVHAMSRDFHEYCQERAKGNAVAGWLPLAEIRRSFLELPKEWFETEVMGWRSKGEGCVIQPDKVAAAYKRAEAPQPEPGVPVVAGVDWGFKGMLAVDICQFPGTGMRHLASAEFRETDVDGIAAYLQGQAEELGELLVYADSSHPFENSALRGHGFNVVEVVFSTYKESGAGCLAHFFEKDSFEGCARFVTARAQLLKWRRGKDGRIRKGDDHHPDALLCATKYYAERHGARLVTRKFDIMSLGRKWLARVVG